MRSSVSGKTLALTLGVFTVLALIFCTTGCVQQPTKTQQGTTSGIANPASVNCVNVGGTLKIIDSAGGQYGMCQFPNGTSCEEWALFRGEGCKPRVTVTTTRSLEVKGLVNEERVLPA